MFTTYQNLFYFILFCFISRLGTYLPLYFFQIPPDTLAGIALLFPFHHSHLLIFRAFLEVSTNFLTRKLLQRWYAGVVIFLTAELSEFTFSELMALSEISSSGKPYLANSSWKSILITVELRYLHFKISSHLLKLHPWSDNASH